MFQSEEVLWEVSDRVRSQRLKRFTVPLEEQLPTESEKKWQKVTEAIMAENQEAATEQKTVLEDEQRSAVAERAEAGSTWLPRHFVYDGTTWRYRHEDLRPWDDGNDLKEYENDYVIAVHRRHQTPIMRTSSLISVESKVKLNRNTSSTITVIPAPSKNQLNFNRTSQSNSCSNNHNNNNNNVCTPSNVVEINHKTAATTSTTGLITTNDSGSGMPESPCSSTSASGSNFETDQLLEMLSSLEQMLLSLNPEAGIAAIRDLIQQAEESQSVSQVYPYTLFCSFYFNIIIFILIARIIFVRNESSYFLFVFILFSFRFLLVLTFLLSRDFKIILTKKAKLILRFFFHLFYIRHDHLQLHFSTCTCTTTTTTGLILTNCSKHFLSWADCHTTLSILLTNGSVCVTG